MESATLAISFSLCEMMMQEMPCALNSAMQVQEFAAVLVVERGGRLVQDEQLDLLGRAPWRSRRAAACRRRCRRPGCAAGPVSPTRFSSAVGVRQRLVPADDAAGGVLVAEEDVLGDGQVRDQREFLVDDHDAALLARADVLELAGLAVEEDLPFVTAVRIDAAEHLHQGRLARAVLTADGVDLALGDGQVDVGERLDTGEGLGDGAHFEDGLAIPAVRAPRGRRIVGRATGSVLLELASV